VFKSPKKIFENYKSDFPENTIRLIEEGFKKVNLFLEYKPIGSYPFYSGRVNIIPSQIGANGKGLTPILAKASAFAELAERYSSGHIFDLIFLKDFIIERNLFFRKNENYNTIIDKFIYYDYLKTPTNSNHSEMNKKVSVYDYFKRYNVQKFELEIYQNNELLKRWVDAYSLNDQQYKKIPINLIRRISGSNGLASGNSMEEAFVQASCEIFERYSILEVLKKKIPITQALKSLTKIC